MQIKEIEEFRDAATKYCDLIDSCNSYEGAKKIQSLLGTLSTLYTKALVLPDVDVETNEPSDFPKPEPLIEFGDWDAYAMIFHPFQDKNPVIGLLSDDLSDIYTDVKRGLLIYEQGAQMEAVWVWKFNFEVHWGRHVTSAIHALHSFKYDNL